MTGTGPNRQTRHRLERSPDAGEAGIVQRCQVTSGNFSHEVDSCTPQAWNALMQEFRDASYNQLPALASHIWGENRLSHIIVRQGDKAVAAAQLVLLTVPVLGYGMAYLKFGPVWQRKAEPVNGDALEAILQAIKEEYADRRGLLVMALPPPDPLYGETTEQVLAEHGFTIRRAMIDPNRYLVNVTLPEDDQRRSLSQKWRYNLKKSLANGIDVSLYPTSEGLDAFSNLYGQMLDRKQFNDANAAGCLPDLLEHLPEPLQPKIVIASHDGRPTAGAVVGLAGTTASYMFGASDDRALPMKAGYALQWWIINWLRDAGFEWYDLGGEAQFDGLRQFKKGLVGKSGKIVTWRGEYEYWTNPLSRLAADGVAALRSIRRSVRHFDSSTAGK